MTKMKRIVTATRFSSIKLNCVLQNMVDFTIEDGRRHVRFGNLFFFKNRRRWSPEVPQ